MKKKVFRERYYEKPIIEVAKEVKKIKPKKKLFKGDK